MRNKNKIMIVIGMVVLHLILINIFSSMLCLAEDMEENKEEDKSYGINGMQKIGVNEKINVRVVREKFFGKIVVSNGKENAYIFNLIKFPIKSKEHSFIAFHILFLVSLVMVMVLMEIVEKPKHLNNRYN